MKITEIKPFSVWCGKRNLLLVKVETDAGIYGWGESGLSGRELAVKGMVEHYREFLIGKDPMRRGALWQEMYRSQYFEGGRTLAAAISAIDIALHDLAGKALGVPVYDLLGGRHRDFVPGFASTSAATTEGLIDDAQALIDDGWTAMRLGFCPGGEGNVFEPRVSIAATAERVVASRDALGREVVLGVDYHHRLSVAEAASFCQMLPLGMLDFLEEPIRDESPEAYEALRRMTPMPLAIGEEFSSKWQFLPYVERGITNFARLDVCNVGGFSEAMKVAGWCEAHYIDMMPHNPLGPVCTAASVHFSLAVPNFSWMEVSAGSTEDPGDRNDATVFPEQVRRVGPNYPAPEAPGLGVEVNEAALNRPFEFWEPGRMVRGDGSYTNH
jgi:galactonate dehydratase